MNEIDFTYENIPCVILSGLSASFAISALTHNFLTDDDLRECLPEITSTGLVAFIAFTTFCQNSVEFYRSLHNPVKLDN